MTFEDVVSFLRDNWSFISTGILTVLSIVILIVKKRPKKWDELNQIITQCIAKVPGFVCEAEEMNGYTGLDKKNFVVSWCFQFIENTLKRDLTLSEEQYAYKAISYFIEAVLTAPTKEGGFGREQIEQTQE